MRALGDLPSCLQRLGGLSGIGGESVPIGDEAFLVHYRRPTASLPVEVVVVYARSGDVVTSMTHLGYPSAEEALTATLTRAAGTQLAAQS